jgi:hypothetical protein
MYNNNNNKLHNIFYKYILYLIIHICVTKNLHNNKNQIMNKLITLQCNQDFFAHLQKACEKENINIAICTPKQLPNIYCNFYHIPLQDILNITLGTDFSIKTNKNFVIINDPIITEKIYRITIPMNEEQTKNFISFLQNYTDYTKSKFIYNKDDGIVIFIGLEKHQKQINEYIEYINILYSQQIMCECRIISITHSKKNNKSLNLLDHLQKILKINNYNLLGSRNQTIFNLDYDMHSILDILSKMGQVEQIHHLKFRLMHNKEGKLYTNETRYSDKYYDATLSTNAKYNNAIIKNLKTFDAGIVLSLTPQIQNNDVILTISYEQISFQDDYKKDLPNIIKNGFSFLIKVEYDKLIIINSLNNTKKQNSKIGLMQFWLWDFLFGHDEEKETECQIIFLIKLYKI